MTSIPDMSVLFHRLTENETMTRQIHERQIRTDARVAHLGEGQREMRDTLLGIQTDLKAFRDDQDRSASRLNNWIKAIFVLVPLVPVLLHMVGR